MSDAELTPGRSTRVHFDLTETALVESAFSVTRAGAEIGRDIALGLANDTPADDDARHGGVVYWASGAVTLKPLQHDVSNLHEGVVCFPHIVSVPSKMTLLQGLGGTQIEAEFKYRQSADLPGFSASSNIQPQGDPYLVKSTAAGATTSASLSDGLPAPPLVSRDIPMERVGYSNDAYRADQGYFLQWLVPGSASSVFQYTWAFYFGQYGLCLRGTGRAELWEYCLNQTTAFGSGAFRWRRRAGWQYARPGQVSQTKHTMAVYPHVDPSGRRYISFTNNQLEAANAVSQFAHTDAAQVAPGEFLYHCDNPNRSPNDRDESPGHATKSDIFRLDIRQDLNVEVQVSTLAFPASGFLVDLPANLPPLASAASPLYCYPFSLVPPGCGLAATMLDARTGAAFAPGGAGPSVRFDFTGDGRTTPTLWRYLLARDPVTATNAPGKFTAPVTHVSVQGVSGDPSQDTAQITLEDTQARLPRLRSRGRLSVSLTTTDAAGTVVLHRGYAMRPTGTRRGTAGRSAPAPDWQTFSVPLVGMAQRLFEKYQGPSQRKYSLDIGATPLPNGSQPPFKVTDAVRDLLFACGYPPEQIAIGDNPTRLWPGETVKVGDLVLDAAATLGEYIVRLVRDMLGAYLIFDANAGGTDVNGLPLGQWTLLYQTPLPASGQFAPLFNFVTRPASPSITPPHVLAAYPAGTAPILGRVESTTVPPDFNSFLVTTRLSITGNAADGAVSSRAYNYRSFSAPGSGVALDPLHPDYLGFEKQMVYPDPTLAGSSVPETQLACDFLAARLLAFCGHGQRLAHFTVPLIFVTDPAGGYRRTLRFQDPISINGDASWLVKACHPRYAKDGYQVAEIEAIQPVAGQSVPMGTEAISLDRHAGAQQARRATGAGTQSLRFGRKAVTPSAEQSTLELPSLLAYQRPLQDPATGALNFILGFSALGDAGLA